MMCGALAVFGRDSKEFGYDGIRYFPSIGPHVIIFRLCCTAVYMDIFISSKAKYKDKGSVACVVQTPTVIFQ